jgi:hypothetical protein
VLVGNLGRRQRPALSSRPPSIVMTLPRTQFPISPVPLMVTSIWCGWISAWPAGRGREGIVGAVSLGP